MYFENPLDSVSENVQNPEDTTFGFKLSILLEDQRPLWDIGKWNVALLVSTLVLASTKRCRSSNLQSV